MASTFGGIVAHVSSASDTSESVLVIEKTVEDNEKSDIESILQALTGSEHPKPLIFLHNNHSLLLARSLQTMCVFFLSSKLESL